MLSSSRLLRSFAKITDQKTMSEKREALHLFIVINSIVFLIRVALGVKIDRENARRRLACERKPLGVEMMCDAHHSSSEG